MKKSSIFISAILTTFVLVILSGAISAFRTYAEGNTQLLAPAIVQAASQQVTQASTQDDEQEFIQESPSATATTALLTPIQGAELAAQYLGRSDLYSVESAILYGLNVYLVTFSSGDQAYVSQDGQILRVVPASSAVVQNSSNSSSSSGNTGNSGGNGGGDHDGGDDD